MKSSHKSPVHIPGKAPISQGSRQIQVEVEVPGGQAPIKFFNYYYLERRGDFIHIQLFYKEGDRIAAVSHSVMCLSDSNMVLQKFKVYVSKLAPIPDTTEFAKRHDLPFIAPQSFNAIEFARRPDMGELTFNQFSHRELTLAAKSVPEGETARIKGRTQGVYVSPLEVHKCLLWDFVNVVEGN